MGLDNGIYVKKNGEEVNIEDVGGNNDVLANDDVCYWRKFWEFRKETIEYLERKYGKVFDNEEVLLDADDLKWFRGQITYWLTHPKVYEAMSNGYWEWNEYTEETLQAEIFNLNTVIKLLESGNENGEYGVYWYDSY